MNKLFINHNYEAIKKVLYDSGFQDRLDTLEEGIETKLTREFDEAGINLSGGEAHIDFPVPSWQTESICLKREESSNRAAMKN